MKENKENSIVNCKWCKSSIYAETKICPNCKKPLITKKQLKINRIIATVVSFIFILFIIILGIVIYEEFANETIVDCENAEHITINKLYEELSNNKVKATELYNDKTYIINGEIDKISSEILLTDTDNAIHSIEVYYNKTEKDKVLKLNKGDKITVCGNIKIDEPTVFGLTTWDIKDSIIIND